MTRNHRPTRVERIIEAQRVVEHWLQHLSNLTADDPRFDGALVGYEAAIDFRRLAENS